MKCMGTSEVIDRSLNYGRHHIGGFLGRAKSAKAVLDLGAGHGTDLGIAREVLPDARLYAVENWPPYVEELSKQGINVSSLDLEREMLPFHDGDIDIVIANQVLEHTKEIFWIFHEVTRVLSVGGSFIIGVPNLASLHNRVLLSLGRQPTPIKSASAHVRGFTRRDLLNFVVSCFPQGFELTAFGGSNFYPFPPGIAKPLAAVFPNAAWGIFLMLQKRREYRGEFLEFPKVKKLETNFFLGERLS